MTHAHSMFSVSSFKYVESDLWGILEPLQDDGMPSYV